MSGAVLAPGEEIVRRYSCTAVDRVALFAGTVLPLPGSTESEGVLTLTNRRIMFDLSAGSGGMHQETRLSHVSSVSSMMSKFGRDLRVPILLIIAGFLMMFAPYVALEESGQFDLDGEYQEGYNAGIEYQYFSTYLKAIQDGRVADTIPRGYYFYPEEPPLSPEYSEGYRAGMDLGTQRAEEDISAGNPCMVPSALMTSYDPSLIAIVAALAGFVVFVMGSVVYLVSNQTKDWINIRVGSGTEGIAIKSVDGAWDRTGSRALVPSGQYWDMTRELGAAILDLRHRKQTGLRFVEEDDDVVIEEEQEDVPEERLLERVPDSDEFTDEVLILDDDDDSRVIAPWREE